MSGRSLPRIEDEIQAADLGKWNSMIARSFL
jgi:hypothetical protein